MNIACFLAMSRNFKKIRAWQNARDLIKEIYKISKKLPKEEIFGLTSQLRRASVSIAANIAEGAARQHKKEYLNFLYIANASLVETECLLILISDVKLLIQSDISFLMMKLKKTSSSLIGLINSVKLEI